ncbi:MAG: hypothetical protein HY701_10965 [Gemmatimonadetes bacterium]|nr:hypothetical protein [Gemmatimonadota bacterium]
MRPRGLAEAEVHAHVVVRDVAGAAKTEADPGVYRRLAILYRRLGCVEDAAAAEATLERLARAAQVGR